MIRKQHYILLIALLCFNIKSNADVIFPVYSADKFVAAASIEKIFSYEKQLGKSFSIMPWIGGAIFWPFYQQRFDGPVVPSVGLEGALEARWYPSQSNISGYFIGIYGGGALMTNSYAAKGAAIGLKTGYKKILREKIHYRFSFEPYGSVSTLPAVHSTFYNNDEVLHFPGAILTLGIRFVSEWRKKN